MRSRDHMDCLFNVKRVLLILVGCFKENKICMSQSVATSLHMAHIKCKLFGVMHMGPLLN